MKDECLYEFSCIGESQVIKKQEDFKKMRSGKRRGNKEAGKGVNTKEASGTAKKLGRINLYSL